MTLQRDLLIGSQKYQGIRDGMPVFDLDNHKIGKVKQLYYGMDTTSSAYMEAPAHDAMFEEAAVLLKDASRFPDALRERMLREGFVRIDSGLFSSDRFVLAEQIDNVADDRINLNVPKDELLKG